MTRGPWRPGQELFQHAVPGSALELSWLPAVYSSCRLESGVPRGEQPLLPGGGRRHVGETERLGEQVPPGSPPRSQQEVLLGEKVARLPVPLHDHLPGLVLGLLVLLLDHLLRQGGRERVDVENLGGSGGLGATACAGCCLVPVLLPEMLQQFGLARVLLVAEFTVMWLRSHATHLKQTVMEPICKKKKKKLTVCEKVEASASAWPELTSLAPAGRAAPGWIFRMWFFRLLLDL